MKLFPTSSSAIAGIIPALLSSALLMICDPPSAQAGPAEEYGLFKSGEGRLRWFGISIFTAQLWTDSGASQADLYGRPVMLSIEYDWNISRDRFLKATREEWQRLDGELDAREIEWLEQLAAIYPDIKSGQQLSSLVIPNAGTRFYLDDEEIGQVTDADFGASFLAIWLDRNTRDARVRKGLLNNLPATRNMDQPDRVATDIQRPPEA